MNRTAINPKVVIQKLKEVKTEKELMEIIKDLQIGVEYEK